LPSTFELPVARNDIILNKKSNYNLFNEYIDILINFDLNHLIKAKEMLGATLLTIHNEFFIVNLVAKMRQSIIDGNFFDFKEEFLGRYYATKVSN
jgi:queuine/archaeosine tRNA-ribosyltransferase